MHKKKWLIYIVAILIIIFLFGLFISKTHFIDSTIKNILTTRLGKQLNADIEFSSFILTTRFIQISDLNISEKNGLFRFSAKQLYVEYNLIKLILTSVRRPTEEFNIVEAIRKISLFSPEIAIDLAKITLPPKNSTIHPDLTQMYIEESENDNQNFDLLDKLKQIYITNGKLQIKWKDEHNDFYQDIQNIDCVIESAEDEITFIFSATQSKSDGTISIKGGYKNKEDYNFIANLKAIKVSKARFQKIEIEKADINGNIEIKNNHFTQDSFLEISDLLCRINKQELALNKAKLSCQNKDIIIEQGEFTLLDNLINCSGKIKNVLSSPIQPEIDIVSDNFMLNNILPEIKGKIKVLVKIRGSVDKPEFNLSAYTPSLQYQKIILKHVSLKSTFIENNLTFDKSYFSILNNRVGLTGKINIKPKDLKESNLNLTLRANNFNTNLDFGQLSGNIITKITGSLRNYQVETELYKSSFTNDSFYTDFKGYLGFNQQNLIFSFSDNQTGNYFIISGKGENILSNPKFSVRVKTNSFPLTSIYRQQNKLLTHYNPIINTDIELNYGEILKCEGEIDFENNGNSEIEGKLLLAMQYYPERQDTTKSSFSLRSEQLKLNGEEYAIDIQAQGRPDHWQIKNFNINDDIYLAMDLFSYYDKTGIYYWSGIQLKGKLIINNLLIRQVQQFLLLDGGQIEGVVNGQIDFSKKEKLQIQGKLLAREMKYQEIENIVSNLKFRFHNDELIIDTLEISSPKEDIITGYGKVSLLDSCLHFHIWNKGVQVENVISKQDIKGKIDYDCLVIGKISEPTLLLNLSGKDIKIGKFSFDKGEIKIFQDNDFIHIRKAYLQKKADNCILELSGQYAYNLFKREFTNQSSDLNISYQGDMLKEISYYIGSLEKATGKTNITLKITTPNKEINIAQGKIKIRDGRIKIKNQPQEITKIKGDITIQDGKVIIKNISGKIGDDRLYITNSFEYPKREIKTELLNLGTILIRTGEKGVLLNYPDYMPTRESVVNAKLRGREDEYFKIFGPIDNLTLYGDIFLENGKVIYPPIKKGKGDKKSIDQETEPEVSPIQINLDINLFFSKNIWYVTYPMNIKLNPESWLSLSRYNRDPDKPGKSKTGKKISVNGQFTSSSGSISLFGENFQVVNIEVKIDQYSKYPHITANFEKRLPDGTTIFLDAYTTTESNGEDIRKTEYGNFKLVLHTDSPDNETVAQIFSKMRYGKEFEQLSDEEKKALYLDEAIKFAGQSIGDRLLNPLLNPVETKLRRWLGLDFFKLKTGLVENIILKSGILYSEEDKYKSMEERNQLAEISQISKEIVLNNLSLSMGKYITRSWYVSYQALLQKELTGDNIERYGLSHQILFQYELPLGFRVSYKYQYSSEEDNEQEISLQKTFRF